MPQDGCSPGPATLRHQKRGHGFQRAEEYRGKVSLSRRAPQSPPCGRVPPKHRGDTGKENEETKSPKSLGSWTQPLLKALSF